MSFDIFSVPQMHCQKIEKNSDVPDDKEIRGYDGNGRAKYRVMKNVSFCVKPNSQVSAWSSPIYMLHSFPPDGALPEGSLKHHLFKRSTHKGLPLKQTDDELK